MQRFKPEQNSQSPHCFLVEGRPVMCMFKAPSTFQRDPNDDYQRTTPKPAGSFPSTCDNSICRQCHSKRPNGVTPSRSQKEKEEYLPFRKSVVFHV
jgi:hypothetical protein